MTSDRQMRTTLAQEHEGGDRGARRGCPDGHDHGDEQDRRDRRHEVDGCHRRLAGTGTEIGAQHEGNPGGQGAEGGHDAVEPHAGVEPRDPGADQHDDGHVHDQVGREHDHLRERG